MSTFDGYVKEFPRIAIDFFRPRPPGSPSIVAHFLSHIHSDHLQGLENASFGGGFIYCSEITKAILLKLQVKSVRTQLEETKDRDRSPYKYGHLQRTKGRSQDLLRCLPLHRPTTILVGDESLTVTLFDANHCPGAVMFLIESSTACVLYTGDVRAEPKFIYYLKTHPLLSSYFAKHRLLDCLYLDTSAREGGPDYKPNAYGCQQLLHDVAMYPDNMIFNFPARCLGYEDVLLSLARHMNMPVHVDTYTYGLYAEIARMGRDSKDAAVLQYLTTDASITRLHSCMKSDNCVALASARASDSEVYIKVVSAIYTTSKSPNNLSAHDQSVSMGETDFDGDIELVDYSQTSGNNLQFELYGEKPPGDDGSITSSIEDARLPRTLVFPFARHSSWSEQKLLVETFAPKDVQSCTGETSHLYIDLISSAAESEQRPGMMNLTDAQLKRRHALHIVAHAEYARHDWGESPRIIRQRLSHDVDV